MSELPTDPDHAAVARLTAKERECLERWLGHATAKEIALDLGITHHAVEKRLKSARQKLGVATSLDAARILADAEGYDRMACGSSDLSGSAVVGQMEGTDARARPATTRHVRHRLSLVAGGLSMTTALLLAITLTQQTLPTPDAPSEEDMASMAAAIGAQEGRWSDPEAAFGRLDQDGSGYLEEAELNGSKAVAAGLSAFLQTEGMATAFGNGEPLKFDLPPLSAADKDADGRLDLTEFGDWRLSVQRTT